MPIHLVKAKEIRCESCGGLTEVTCFYFTDQASEDSYKEFIRDRENLKDDHDLVGERLCIPTEGPLAHLDGCWISYKEHKKPVINGEKAQSCEMGGIAPANPEILRIVALAVEAEKNDPTFKPKEDGQIAHKRAKYNNLKRLKKARQKKE